MGAVAKLNSREITPYLTGTANALCQGPVAGICNLRGNLQGRQDVGNRESRSWLAGSPCGLKAVISWSVAARQVLCDDERRPLRD